MRRAILLGVLCLSSTSAWAQKSALNARKLLDQGRTAAKAKDYDGAIESLRMALKAAPALSEASDALGRLLIKKKQYGDASAVFMAAVQANPNYHKGFYRLGYALRKAGELADAAGAYEQYVQLRPHDPDGYYGLATTYAKLKERDLAVGAYQKYVTLEKRPKEQKWVDKAKKKIVALGGVVPKDNLLDDVGGPDQAPKPAKVTAPKAAARAPAPRTTSGGVRSGDQAFSAGDYPSAIAAYRGAIQADAQDPEARYKLSVALVARQQLQDAENELLALVQMAPTLEAARRLLDRVRLRRSEISGAAPGTPTGQGDDLLKLGEERLEARDYALADQLLRRARASGANAPLCDRLMGEALSAQGAFDRAADAYTRALGHGLEGLRAHRGLARVYEQLGDLKRAAYHLDLFLQIAPSEPSMGALEEADAERMLRSVETRLAGP